MRQIFRIVSFGLASFASLTACLLVAGKASAVLIEDIDASDPKAVHDCKERGGGVMTSKDGRTWCAFSGLCNPTDKPDPYTLDPSDPHAVQDCIHSCRLVELRARGQKVCVERWRHQRPK